MSSSYRQAQGPPRRLQFVSDRLVAQILEGRKTASVATLDEVDVDEDEYNHALVVGQYYDVHCRDLRKACTVRIVGMELCRWDDVPERLWKGETNTSAQEFRDDHVDFFNDPGDDFEFVAYYFELIRD